MICTLRKVLFDHLTKKTQNSTEFSLACKDTFKWFFSFLRNNPSCGFIYNDFRLFVFFLSSMYDTYIISKVLCDI